MFGNTIYRRRKGSVKNVVKLLLTDNNNSGPRIDPCGTPEVTLHDEEQTLYILTCCVRLLR